MALRAGTLANVVVIHVGTNGVFDRKGLDQLLDDLGGRRVVLVNTHVPRPWESYNNKAIPSVAAKHANVRVVDWNGLANAHASWFGTDGTHPGPAGGAALAALIRSAVAG